MKKQLLLMTTGLLAAAALYAETPQPVFKIGKAVTPPDENAKIVFEIPDGITNYYSRNCEAFSYDWEGVSRSDIKGSVVRSVYVEEDGNLWLSNPLSDFVMLSYVKASFDSEGSIVIEGPQFIYDEYDDYMEEWVNFYLIPMKMVTDEIGATYVPAEDMKYVLKKTENGYKAADPDMMLAIAKYGDIVDNDGNYTGEEGYIWSGYGDRNITLDSRQATNGVTPPAGVVWEKWAFVDPYENGLINVAIDGNDLYIQGMDRGIKDAWVKATISGEKVTIPSGAFLGIKEDVAFFSYLWGSKLEYDEENEELRGGPTDEVVFSYNVDKKSLVLQDGYAICSMPEDFFLLTLYEDVSIYKQNRNINTPPSKPYDLVVTQKDDYFECGHMDFRIPSIDVDGNILDIEKLYYRIYVDNKVFEFTPEEYPYLELTENMVNVPYALWDNDMIFVAGNFHSLYFASELPESGCGVQTVYINEEGKELYSDITTADDSGVNGNMDERIVVARSFYNMQGQAVTESYEGPKVSRIIYDDGTVRVFKSMNVGR